MSYVNVRKKKNSEADLVAPLYTLRVAAELSGVSKYSIRQYIDRKLLLPYTTKTGRHLFSKIDITRLVNIRRDLAEGGLNIAGIKRVMAQTPCWLIRPCSKTEYSHCEAYWSAREPCWQVSIKGPNCRDSECRNCEVYQLVEECDDVKSLFKSFCGDNPQSI